MRKLQRVALVVAAAGGLSAVGAGPSSAVTPVAYDGTVPPPVSQPDAQAASATSSQASVQTYGSPAPQQAAPQRGTQVSPQVNPQLNPQINPHISPQAPQSEQGGPVGQANLFRPYQECSPQNLLAANVPVALLAASQTRGVDCTQANSQANSFANARTR
ncbi:hypothetical protein [Streptomyces chromofuscus]|uniref:Secreted protein n=1 Tax=Streptomyces chromofuscus TaxID=42881 RepID=A0A7M2T284_STRCW|nr:hypothetical protein [Streptomyces chromofuscus]QOV42736.1 hypothetical protein IPT68_23410 [Streptomyces chromofuscus]GGS90413.1 hypothetical protein GCM10010254_07850 [Streptomyces chromofuscus]